MSLLSHRRLSFFYIYPELLSKQQVLKPKPAEGVYSQLVGSSGVCKILLHLETGFSCSCDHRVHCLTRHHGDRCSHRSWTGSDQEPVKDSAYDSHHIHQSSPGFCFIYKAANCQCCPKRDIFFRLPVLQYPVSKIFIVYLSPDVWACKKKHVSDHIIVWCILYDNQPNITMYNWF